jgi:hypothetical protein
MQEALLSPSLENKENYAILKSRKRVLPYDEDWRFH